MLPNSAQLSFEEAGASDRFRSATHSILERLRGSATQRTFVPGDVLLSQGELPVHVVMLTRGLLKLAHQDDDGRDMVIAARSSERPFGTLALIAGVPQPYRVEAVTSCVAYVVAARIFEAQIARDGELMRAVLALHALEALETAAPRTHAHCSARARIARLIVTLAGIQGMQDGPQWVRVPLPVTHEALASLAGVSPETFSRTLAQMERETLIERGHGWLRVQVTACLA